MYIPTCSDRLARWQGLRAFPRMRQAHPRNWYVVKKLPLWMPLADLMHSNSLEPQACMSSIAVTMGRDLLLLVCHHKVW